MEKTHLNVLRMCLNKIFLFKVMAKHYCCNSFFFFSAYMNIFINQKTIQRLLIRFLLDIRTK